MLTENDIKKLNNAKTGDEIELEDGRMAYPRVVNRKSACNECDFRDEEDCTKINCANMSSTVYHIGYKVKS